MPIKGLNSSDFSYHRIVNLFILLLFTLYFIMSPHLYYHRIVNLHPFHHRADIRTFQNCLSFNKISLSFCRWPTTSAISNMVLTDTNVWLTDMAEILDLYQRGWLGGMNGHFQPQGIKWFQSIRRENSGCCINIKEFLVVLTTTVWKF